jgi:hypothetical protein
MIYGLWMATQSSVAQNVAVTIPRAVILRGIQASSLRHCHYIRKVNNMIKVVYVDEPECGYTVKEMSDGDGWYVDGGDYYSPEEYWDTKDEAEAIALDMNRRGELRKLVAKVVIDKFEGVMDEMMDEIVGEISYQIDEWNKEGK